MKKWSKILIGIGAAIVLVAIYVFYDKTDWKKSYKSEGKKPYDLDIIHNLLLEKFHHKRSQEYVEATDSSLSNFNTAGLNYVFIGETLYTDSAEEANLLQFVAQGNTAIIASERLPQIISELSIFHNQNNDDSVSAESDTLIDESQFDYFQSYWFDTIPILIPGEKMPLNFYYVYDNTIVPYVFESLNPRNTLQEGAKIIGPINDTICNFFSVEYGRGKFIFNTTPITFTNYSLSKERNVVYADWVFSQLDTSKGIFWDEYNKTFHFNDNISYSQEEESPLRYILSQRGLRIAWYLSLGLLLLYILFVGKRRQRAIPVLEKTKNTSLEYIQTVGKLYYAERDHRNICLHKMKLFNTFLRNHYSINASVISDELQDKIALISGVSIDEVKAIYSSFFWIDKQVEVSDDQLITFMAAINNFYKKCK